MILAVLLAAAPVPVVSPVPQSLRAAFGLSTHYEKVVMAREFPILGSAKASDAALREARSIVLAMTATHPEYLDALAKAKIRLVVMAPSELTTSVPEHADLAPAAYWDRRARGLGATLARPAISCAEENLLEEPGDPYSAENICVHEFAHTLHELAIATLDPSFQGRLDAAFATALSKGTWKNTYAASNVREYWAEVVQSWFDTNRHDDAEHGTIDTRDELRAADPGVSALIASTIGELPWKYRRPSARTPAERAELGAWPNPLPTFAWPAELKVPTPERPMRFSREALTLSSSPRSSEASTLHVVNRGPSPIELHWLDFKGKLVKYATIEPQGSSEQPTYAGHVWVALRDGKRIGWIAAPSGRATVTIDPEPATLVALSLDRRPLTLARSPESQLAVTLEIENREPFAIEWSWLTFEGTFQRYATIEPGTALTQPTYARHVWVVRHHGEQLGWLSAPEGGGRLSVGPSSSVRLETKPLTVKVSPASTRAVTITLENATQRPIEWSWLGFDGSLRQYAVVAPGASLDQPTFEGHVWVVTRKGRRLGWFTAPSTSTRLLVREP